MAEELIDEIIRKIEEKAYTPPAWVGLTNVRGEVHLEDVINILNEYKKEKSIWR
jgi:hypothetical protein